nr:MAG TPA: hypothetical protein [Caudoviricetes sp.]
MVIQPIRVVDNTTTLLWLHHIVWSLCGAFRHPIFEWGVFFLPLCTLAITLDKNFCSCYHVYAKLLFRS